MVSKLDRYRQECAAEYVLLRESYRRDIVVVSSSSLLLVSHLLIAIGKAAIRSGWHTLTGVPAALMVVPLGLEPRTCGL